MRKLYFLFLILLINSVMSPTFGSTSGSDSLRMHTIEGKLAAVAQTDSTFYQEVDLSVGKISLSEMLRNIAKVSNVNLTVKGGENIMVSVNFSRARVIDLLYYLCKEYDLDVDVVGNIVSIYPLQLPPPPLKEITIQYDSVSNSLTYDLSDDKLIDVTKKITTLSTHNIIIPQGLHQSRVSGFVQQMRFDEAVETLAAINGLIADKNDNGIWSLDVDPESSEGNYGSAFTRRNRFRNDELIVDSLGTITARLNRANVQDVIVELCEQLELNYFFLSPIQHETGVFVRDVTFGTLLDVLLAGTSSSYYVDSNIYIFGDSGHNSKLTSVQIIPMVARSVNKVEESIPQALMQSVQVKPFPELNSMIVSGEQKDVSRVVNFINSIDKRIPMITIEILIVDITKTNILETGIGMGIGDSKKKTKGTLSPGIDMTFGSSSINNVISSINGFGKVNLGKVTPQFYIDLKLLEENGVLQLHSTPKLSTLNGQEATLKSGETRYYKEITNNYIGSGIGNPTVTENYIWKSIDAALSVKITPYVSADNVITLDIEVQQTEFTNVSAAEDAPPGTATRSFKSTIKMGDEEVVLLGGIDRNMLDRAGRGLPYVSRPPVLRSIFGKNKNNKVDQKLSVLIKPTITY